MEPSHVSDGCVWRGGVNGWLGRRWVLDIRHVAEADDH